MRFLIRYCQKRGLRILALHAFKFFLKFLKSAPGNYLEIGVFEGYMILELARRFPKKMFYGVDPFIEDGHTSGHNGGVAKGEATRVQMDAARANTAGVPNIQLFEETSRSFFHSRNDFDFEQMNLSAILIDGDHSYEEARNDMFNSARAMKAGVIFIDDLGLPEVNLAAEEFIKHLGNRLVYRHNELFFLA